MGGFVRKITGKPKKERYKATSMEKFQTQFSTELLERLNPNIRKVISAIRDYGSQDFASEQEGIANFDAMKAASIIPGPIGTGVALGIGVGNIIKRTSNVDQSADRLIGTLSNMSTASTKGKVKATEANMLAVKGQAGEFDTLTKGIGANVKLSTSDLLGQAAYKTKRDSAAMNLFMPAFTAAGVAAGKALTDSSATEDGE